MPTTELIPPELQLLRGEYLCNLAIKGDYVAPWLGSKQIPHYQLLHPLVIQEYTAIFLVAYGPIGMNVRAMTHPTVVHGLSSNRPQFRMSRSTLMDGGIGNHIRASSRPR